MDGFFQQPDSDPGFAQSPPDEADTLFLSAEPDTATFIPRDRVNAAIGVERWARSVDKPTHLTAKVAL